MVSGETICYPKEEGPYSVFVSGECNEMAGNLSTLFRIMPFWFLLYPRHIEYRFEEDSVFFVNGEKQNILYPARVDLIGFKGYGQTFFMMFLKWDAEAIIGALFLLLGYTSFISAFKTRVIGNCDEIIVNNNNSATL
jgi:hypothetical protein